MLPRRARDETPTSVDSKPTDPEQPSALSAHQAQDDDDATRVDRKLVEPKLPRALPQALGSDSDDATRVDPASKPLDKSAMPGAPTVLEIKAAVKPRPQAPVPPMLGRAETALENAVTEPPPASPRPSEARRAGHFAAAGDLAENSIAPPPRPGPEAAPRKLRQFKSVPLLPHDSFKVRAATFIEKLRDQWAVFAVVAGVIVVIAIGWVATSIFLVRPSRGQLEEQFRRFSVRMSASPDLRSVSFTYLGQVDCTKSFFTRCVKYGWSDGDQSGIMMLGRTGDAYWDLISQ